MPQGVWPAAYIGKEVHEHASGAWPAVLVRWAWADQWAPGAGALFWGPTALCGGGEYGVTTYDLGRDKRPEDVFVRIEVSAILECAKDATQRSTTIFFSFSLRYVIVRNNVNTVLCGAVPHPLCGCQDLCWVLEPARLCKAVTGKRWAEVEKALKASPDHTARFARHQQLAE